MPISSPAGSTQGRRVVTRPSIDASSFRPAFEVTDAGHVMSFAETWARAEPAIGQIPVTRVYDVGSIDYVKLPVWSAVTPLAKDLTVHSGKGTSPDAARLSAVMEAIERVSAEDVSPEATCRASYLGLAEAGEFQPIDPMLWDLPFDSTYDSDRSFDWVIAYDLAAHQHRWVARDLVISPAQEGVCQGVESNGLASGNSILEATLHALLEVIERDASSQEDYYNANHDPAEDRRALWLVDPASLPARPRTWYDKLTDSRLIVALQDITNDLAVPVYCATIADPDFPGADGEIAFFDGCGADEDPERAAVRALTEATQAHSVVMLGSRRVRGAHQPPARRHGCPPSSPSFILPDRPVERPAARSRTPRSRRRSSPGHHPLGRCRVPALPGR